MKRYLTIALKVSVSLLLVAWFVAHNDLGRIAALFRAIPLYVVAIVMFLDICGIFLDAFQWRVILSGQNYRNLLKADFVAQYYALVLPGQIAGELGKILYLRKAGERGIEEIVASVAVDKVTGLVGAVFLMGSIGAFESSISLPFVVKLIFLLGFLGSIGFFILVRFEAFTRGLKTIIEMLIGRFSRLSLFKEKLATTIDAFRTNSMRGVRIAAAVILGAMFQAISVTIAMTIAAAVGIHIGFFDWCWILSLLALILLFPVSIGGLGVRDAGLVGLLSLFGVAATQALAVSLSLFGLQIVLAAAGFCITLLPIKNGTHKPLPS